MKKRRSGHNSSPCGGGCVWREKSSPRANRIQSLSQRHCPLSSCWPRKPSPIAAAAAANRFSGRVSRVNCDASPMATSNSLQCLESQKRRASVFARTFPLCNLIDGEDVAKAIHLADYYFIAYQHRYDDTDNKEDICITSTSSNRNTPSETNRTN